MLTKSDLSQIQGVVKGVVAEELTPVKKSIKSLEKKLDFSVKYLDREYTLVLRD